MLETPFSFFYIKDYFAIKTIQIMWNAPYSKLHHLKSMIIQDGLERTINNEINSQKSPTILNVVRNLDESMTTDLDIDT